MKRKRKIYIFYLLLLFVPNLSFGQTLVGQLLDTIVVLHNEKDISDSLLRQKEKEFKDFKIKTEQELSQIAKKIEKEKNSNKIKDEKIKIKDEKIESLVKDSLKSVDLLSSKELNIKLLKEKVTSLERQIELYGRKVKKYIGITCSKVSYIKYKEESPYLISIYSLIDFCKGKNRNLLKKFNNIKTISFCFFLCEQKNTTYADFYIYNPNYEIGQRGSKKYLYELQDIILQESNTLQNIYDCKESCTLDTNLLASKININYQTLKQSGLKKGKVYHFAIENKDRNKLIDGILIF